MQPLANIFHHLLEACDRTYVIITLAAALSVSLSSVGSDCTTRLRFQNACGLLNAERQQSPLPSSSSEEDGESHCKRCPVITGHVFS